MKSFQIFVFFNLDLWILSSSWLNIVLCYAHLKEIYALYFSKIKRWKLQRYALGKTVGALL